jgi:hypothetical protein
MTSTREPQTTGGDSDALGLVPTDDACGRRLARADDALVVTLDDTPREWLADCEAAVRPAFVAAYPHPDCVRTVADPGSLPVVAAAVDDFLEATPASATPAVCVASLDPLLEYAGIRATERWLAVVASRVAASGGTLHCHDDEDALAHREVFYEPTAAPRENRT